MMKSRRYNNFFSLFMFAMLCILGYKFTQSRRDTGKAPGKCTPAMENIISAAALKHNVPHSLIKAVIWKESRFRQYEKGAAGELGLMQLMPGAIEEWRRGTKNINTPGEKELLTMELNIEIGTWYLAWCGKHWDKYKSKDILQLAEYNAGYSRVSKKWKPKSPDTEITPDAITFKGTQKYVKDILKKKEEYDNTAISQM